MKSPAPYPRTAYLEDDPAPFLGNACRVEEKLDGANVAIWSAEGALQVMSRGGPDAMDRAQQLGRLRAWVAERDEELRALCSGGTAVYGEWLWLRHGVTYDRLPDWLVVLDLRRTDGDFVDGESRDALVAEAGLITPPVIRRDAVFSSIAEAHQLIPQSQWGPDRAEGVILRTAEGLRCKVVRTDYSARSDESWSGQRVCNQLVVPRIRP